MKEPRNTLDGNQAVVQHEASLASNEQFLDGTLKFGSVEGSRTGDPSVLQVSDPSEGQKILLSVNEARALHLWLGMVLPHSSAPETKHAQAPIARLIICADRPAAVRLYAPGLPPGEHDVYCEPEAVAPMLRAQRCCLAERGGGLVCTRPSGHEGQHEAWGSSADRPRYLIDCWPESSEKAGEKS